MKTAKHLVLVTALALAATALPAASPRFTVKTPQTLVDPALQPRIALFGSGYATFTGQSGSNTFVMVGGNPANTATSTIPVYIVPIVLTFADGTVLDASLPSTCSAQAPSTLILGSPLFNNASWAPGGTNVGNTQYLDFYQRANFWQTVKTNPAYHLLLSASAVPAIQVTVPAASGKSSSAPCGRTGAMELNWLDALLQNTVFPKLPADAGSGAMPVFVLYNTALYENDMSTCCVLGYHSVRNTLATVATGPQPYAVATFDTSGAFGQVKDVAALSHELGEWVANPVLNNRTPAWLNPQSPSTCSTVMEVGDALDSKILPVAMPNGYTYHVQELAFKSWFYRDAPSTAINSWYSSNGTFTTPPTSCGTSRVTLTATPATLPAGASSTLVVKVTATTGNSTPTGTVDIISSLAGKLASYTLTAGTATGTLAMPRGTYTLTANYSGDAVFPPGSSAAVSISAGNSSLSVTPGALTFASQNVGAATASQAVTLVNNGDIPYALSVKLGGASPGDFPTTSACPSSLPVNATCTLAVTFKPTAGGARTATLSPDSAAIAPHSVALSGPGVAGTPKLQLNPASLTFAATSVGSTAVQQTVTISNAGTGPVSGLSLSLTGTDKADFGGTYTCGSTLAAGATCSTSIYFRPTSAGTKSASISFASAGTTALLLPLTGTATAAGPKVAVSATSLVFSSTRVGTTSAPKTIVISNTGGAALNSLALTLAGNNPKDFAFTTTCGATLQPGSTCLAVVTFKPTATSSRRATLSITDATTTPQTITLTGDGR